MSGSHCRSLVVGPLIDDLRPGDVRGHEVMRQLNTLKLEINRLSLGGDTLLAGHRREHSTVFQQFVEGSLFPPLSRFRVP